MPPEVEQPQSSPQSPIISESPNPVTPRQSDEQHGDAQRSFVIIPEDQQIKSFQMYPKSHRGINPYTRPLTISDLDSVLALENAAFSDPAERASKEKVSNSFQRLGVLGTAS